MLNNREEDYNNMLKFLLRTFWIAHTKHNIHQYLSLVYVQKVKKCLISMPFKKNNLECV